MGKDFDEFYSKIETEQLAQLREKAENTTDNFELLAINLKLKSIEASLNILREYHSWLSD